MNRIMAVPVVAAIAMVVAGCGGSHATTPTTHTRTHAAAVAKPDKGATEPADDLGGTTGTGVVGRRQVRAYFRHVSAVRRQLVITRRSTHAMAMAISAGDGYAAGVAARRAAAGVHRAAVIAKRITAPEPLGSIHSELLANLQLGVVYLTQMANDLQSGDMHRIRRWPKTVMPNLHRSERWYAEWAANSAAFASLFGVRAPHWLHTMDRWN